VDAPGGGGKIPVMPTYLLSEGPYRVVLRNFEGVITTYTQPMDYTETVCECADCKIIQKSKGVASLMHGKRLALEPLDLERRKRLS
jgi:lysine 2,3-aminomutase